MSVMPLITAALAPVLTLAKAIPVFDRQKTSLATFPGLFGFLMVAWVYGNTLNIQCSSLLLLANPLHKSTGENV